MRQKERQALAVDQEARVLLAPEELEVFLRVVSPLQLGHRVDVLAPGH